MSYTLGQDEITATIIPNSDKERTEEVYDLRKKLFSYYSIPGQEALGDRDEFDTPPTFHIALRMDGELIGVARLQPVTSSTGGLLPHLSAKFNLFDPTTAYENPRGVIDMSRVGVVENAPPGATEVLVAAVLDLSAASGFSKIVAFTPQYICGWMDERLIPYSIVSGDKVHRAEVKGTEQSQHSTLDLVITSFDASREVAQRFLNYVQSAIKP
jgi:N-acyl-L-homoserine lactone synthetase